MDTDSSAYAAAMDHDADAVTRQARELDHLDLRTLAEVLGEIAAIDPSRYEHTGPETSEVIARYTRRNRLVWSALVLAHEAGVPAGVGVDPADPVHPVVVYIELPGIGQLCWHLPAHQVEWDGHSTAVKYQRIDAFRRDNDGARDPWDGT
ncbi:hypothetical protein [Micromonospora sp. NBC_01796]|uniref:hypothetical protein n=1 Tax=Micromonospora sp. NBC_01796 TaxID=2975987 RepID=UPI002DD7A912|nr:hypothetical protein [Micromonospora sp. NBC_01796]WSA86286.1 hypothetical protein OIE47_01315 [Micromonospora sp. NBC_01796]